MENIELICVGTIERMFEELSINKSPSTVINTSNEAEQLAQELLKMAKQTLFYVQYPRIYPIFLPQPPSLYEGNVTIHFIRHAEAFHNIRPKNVKDRSRYKITDPELTQLGVKQALNLRKTFEPMNRITHILCSPLTRTIQTAQIVFRDLISQGLKIVAYPDLREYGKGPTSTGSSLETLRKRYHNDGQITDLSLVPKGWELNTEDRQAEKDFGIRGKRVRKALWTLGREALKESGGKWHGHDVSRGSTHRNIEIVVVSHGDFLLEMLDLGTMLYNCQWRSFEFKTEDTPIGSEKYILNETRGSQSRPFVSIRK